MTANDKFMLYAYDGDYGLPSLHLECLKVLLYTTITKVPVQIKTLNNIKLCTFYTGPCFVHKNISFRSFSDTVLYLNTLNYNMDINLTPKQRSECLALTNFVLAKLKVAVEFVFWLDRRNFEEFTRIWHSRALPIPYNMVLNKQFKDNATDLVETVCPNDYSIEATKEYMCSLATECLSSLSARLGTSNYFYGDSPSTLDVVVYSYVAPLLKIPFPSNNISGLVALWPNLVNFVKGIDSKYLADVQKGPKYIKNPEKSKTSDDEISYMAISILTLSAATLMFGFAVSKGFISSKLY